MSTPNSICSALIVYGSFAPGGADHHLLSFLPGQWIEGRITADPVDATDCGTIKIGLGDETPAWVINFDDNPGLRSWDKGYDDWARLQWDRWKKLDILFNDTVGEPMIRSSARWWPLTAPDKFHSINVYKCERLHPNSAHDNDAIHPDERSDIQKLWNQTISGESRYDESTFQGFINDLSPSDFHATFGSLPHSEPFINKLNLLFSEQSQTGSEHPSVTADEQWQLYFAPGKTDELTDDQVLQLVREIVEGKLSYVSAIQGSDVEEQIREYDGLRYEMGCGSPRLADSRNLILHC